MAVFLRSFDNSLWIYSFQFIHSMCVVLSWIIWTVFALTHPSQKKNSIQNECCSELDSCELIHGKWIIALNVAFRFIAMKMSWFFEKKKIDYFSRLSFRLYEIYKNERQTNISIYYAITQVSNLNEKLYVSNQFLRWIIYLKSNKIRLWGF